jgi:hypothetical protein
VRNPTRARRLSPAAATSAGFRFSRLAAPQYDWINGILAIGAGHRFPDGPLYSIFEVP